MTLERDRKRLLEKLWREIDDRRVLDAMSKVQRELFVPAASRHYAYDDRPLPIGEGQTISQPFIVALMTQALELSGTEKVLELGTGCGYQAAILAELARHVVTVERVATLARESRRRLKALGYANVEVHKAKEKLGWPEKAPYDAIVVTAAAPKVPQELLKQLCVGGRMVIPVGSRWEQTLLKVRKLKKDIDVSSLTLCRFVPLIGEDAWVEEEY